MDKKLVVCIIKHCKTIDKEIAYNRKLLKEWEEQYLEMKVTPSYSGGCGGSGDIRKPVEDMVLDVSDEAMEEIAQIKKEIGTLMEQKKEYSAMVSKLEYTQKAILSQFYMKGHSWTRIANTHNYSESGCRFIRDKALEKLEEWMESSEIFHKLVEEKFK